MRVLKRRILILALLTLFLAPVLVRAAAGDADDAMTSAAIAAASRAFSDAYVRNDTEALKDAYTEDAVLLPPGREIRGREAAGELFRWGPPYRQIAHSMTSEELLIRDDLAVDGGTWHSTGQRGDTPPTVSSGRYLVVWVRESDGRWRIQYDMWHRAAPSPPSASTTVAGDDLEQLIDWMSGSFGSGEQAAADEDFYDIRLEMVRIWPARDDAAWLYVEQAAADSTDQPYRQRVYRVTRVEPDLFKSEVLTLPNPEAHIGAWRSPESLRELTPEDLELRSGCAVFLRYDASGEFAGGTIGKGCGSGLRGASYATSEVSVTSERIVSWDRGFNEEGEQVWGAEKGAYVFRGPETQVDSVGN